MKIYDFFKQNPLKEYKLKDVEPPSDDHMLSLKKIVESCGVKAQIGG